MQAVSDEDLDRKSRALERRRSNVMTRGDHLMMLLAGQEMDNRAPTQQCQ